MRNKVGLWVWLLLFGIYLATGAQTLTGFGDSDELVTAGFTWSIPHPPGYPLLVTLTYFATHIPFLSPSGGASLLAALIMSATMWTVYDVAVRLVRRPLVAGLGTLAAGTSFLLWSHGSHLEVFGLNALFSILLLRQTLIMTANKNAVQVRSAFLWGVLVGLGLTHHQTFILTLVPMMVYLGIYLWQQPEKMKITLKLAGAAGVTFLAGYVIPLLLMGLRQHDLSWRFVPTFRGMVDFYLRQDYSGYSVEQGQLRAWMSGFSAEKTVAAWHFFSQSLWEHWGILLLAGIAGLALGKRKLKKPYWLLLAGLALSGPILAGYATLPEVTYASFDYEIARALLERIYVLSEVWLSIFVVLGGVFLVEKLEKIFKNKTFDVIKKWGGLTIVVVLAMWVWKSFPAMNLRSYTAMERYFDALVGSMPEQGRLVCFSDITCFGIPYYQHVLGKRQDVVLISNAPQHRYLETQKLQLMPLKYPDNPFRIGETLGWSIHDDAPIHVVQINQVWTQELGLDSQAFWLKPDGYQFQVSTHPDPVLTFKPDYTASELILANSQWQDHRFVRAQTAMLAEQHVLNGVISSRIRQNVWAMNELMIAMKLNPDHKNLTELMADVDKFSGDPRYFGITDGRDTIRAAEACAKKRDLQCELQEWKWVTWQSPGETYRRLMFAATLEKANILELAKREYRHVLVLDPENTTAKQGLYRLQNVPDLSEWFN